MEAARGQEGDSNIPPTRRLSPETTEVNGASTKVTSKVPENSSLGLLLSDITSLILLSLSTEKFLQKADKQHPSDMYPTGSKRETFQLLEAAGSTIDVLYDLLEKETTVAGLPSDLENTLVKSVSTDITEGKGIEKSTSTNGLSASLTSCQSGDYLSCESELSRSLEMYRSCEQLIQSPQKCRRDSYSDQHGKAMFHSSTMDYKLDGNESSRSLSHLDQRSLLTLDSGIASPYQSASLYRQSHDVSQAKDDSFLPMTSSSHKEHDIVGRVRKLKITVDQKLRDSLANLSSLYTDDLGTESLREHVRKMQIRYEKATNDQWKAGSMYDVIMDKALATSVLAMENAQLGNEVNALRQELQLTYEQVKEKESKGLFVSRFHDTIMKSPEKDGSDSDDSSSTDISTPDTQLLSSYAQRRKRNFTREDLTTPAVKTQSPSAMSSGKRKLTVPSDLKGPKYLSISTNTTCDSNSSRSTGSDACRDDSTDASGCCGGLFCCFFRRKLNQSEDSISSC